MLLSLCPLAMAAGQGAPVSRIVVRGNYLLTPARVLSALGLEEGRPVDADALRNAVQQWNEEGSYGTLAYRIEPAEDGTLVVTIDVSERVRITGVYFEGNDRLSSKRLHELIDLTLGQTVSSIQVRAMEQQIVDAYKQAGHPLASVRAVLGKRGAGERDLVFYIAEGPRIFVTAVSFSGNKSVPDKELRRAMQSKVRHWPSFLWPGWFDEGKFSDDVLNVEAALRARGFLDAQAAGYVSYSDDMRSVTLNIVLNEGPLYHVGDLVFEGNTIFRDDELAAGLPMVPGDPFRPADLEASAELIAGMYQDQGYMDVDPRQGTLVAEPVFPPAGTDVTVRFVIREGEPVFIRRIRIVGLTKTRESVVRRALNFYPGERASRAKLKESEQLLINTGYFDPQARQPVQITLAPSAEAMRDAIVRVEEGPTGRFLVGAGLGSDSGLLGELSLVEENFDIANWPSNWDDFWRGNAFRGGGQKLSILLRAGTERSYYSISWLEPAVHNSDYSFGVNLYSTGIVRNEFDETRTGFSLVGGQRLTKFINRTITVGYESIDIDNIATGASSTIVRDAGSHSKPFVRFEVTVERRDDRRQPTEGYAGRGLVELAAGDVRAVKLELSGEKHWTVHETRGRHRHVLSARGRVGVITPLQNRVPVFERYYAGGFTSLRGFEFEGVSPVDPTTKEQIGGEGLLVTSLEYSVPVTQDDMLRLLGFVDAGYVTADAADVLTGWDEARVSTGVGFRWRVPFLGLTTVEVNLAVPLVKQTGDDTQNLHFSFGAERRF